MVVDITGHTLIFIKDTAYCRISEVITTTYKKQNNTHLKRRDENDVIEIKPDESKESKND